MKRRLLLAVVLTGLMMISAPPPALAEDGNGGRLVIGEDYVLGIGEHLPSSLAAVGGQVLLSHGSLVAGDVAVIGAPLTIEGTVNGNVVALGSPVVLTASARIQGDLTTVRAALTRESGSVVAGSISEGQIGSLPDWIPGIGSAPPQSQTTAGSGSNSDGVLQLLKRLLQWQLGSLGAGLLMVLVAIVVVMLAPRATVRMARQIRIAPAASLGVGFLSIIVSGLLGLLMLVVCGLGLLVWLAMAITMLLGWIAAGLWLGQWLHRVLRWQNDSTLLEAGAGIFAITILSRLPFCIGFSLGIVLASLGVGAVWLTRFGSQEAGPTGGERRLLTLPPAGEAVALQPAGQTGVDAEQIAQD